MWAACFSRLRPTATPLAVLFMTLLAPIARSDEPRLSISGYDAVAYFTDGKPIQGKGEFEYLWHRLRWRFASGEHRDLFVKDPDRYTPQYDGYCAMGTSNDKEAHKDTVDPEAWAIVEGKLYLAHDRYWMQVWRRHRRSAGTDRTSWQERRCLPQCRRRVGQGHYIYCQLRHTARGVRQIRRFCGSTISAHLRRRARRSPCRNWPARISWCRSKLLPRFDNAGPRVRLAPKEGLSKAASSFHCL